MNIIFHDLFYTVKKNRDVKSQEQEHDIVYYITPNHFVGIETEGDVLLK